MKRAMVGCSVKVVAFATRDELHRPYPRVVTLRQEIDHLDTDHGEDATSTFATAGARVVAA